MELLKAQHAKEKAALESGVQKIVAQRLAIAESAAEAQLQTLKDDCERLQVSGLGHSPSPTRPPNHNRTGALASTQILPHVG